MSEEQLKEALLKIINHYGIKHQLKYIHSEYFELDEAITQREYPAIAKDKKPYELVEFEKAHIIEEIADIEVMLDQFKAYYDIGQEEVNKVKDYKIKRQLERIENE